MSTNDYVKYMTETFIKHLEKPRSERKSQGRRGKKEKAPSC